MFHLQVQLTDSQISIDMPLGAALFVLGANGTGKSALLQRIAATSMIPTERISANRQNWFASSSAEFLPSQKPQVEQQHLFWKSRPESRWQEQQSRTGLLIYALVDAENTAARAIAEAVRSHDESRTKELAKIKSPIQVINVLFQSSNLPIVLSIESGDKVVARKNNGPAYGIAELSDGERNALLIATDVITAKPGTLLIIDEPERHLHRSISSPLISRLIEIRQDCYFIVATHDIQLPTDNSDSQVLLVRGCVFSGQTASSWEADLVPATMNFDESLRTDVLGARRKMLFVEGTDSSLDKRLYGVLFPDVSVISKKSSRDVEYAVRGLRSTSDAHWIQAFGFIDNDGRTQEQIKKLVDSSIHVLPLFSIEALYYHPRLIAAVARRMAHIVGESSDDTVKRLLSGAIQGVSQHIQRLSGRACEKKIRNMILSSQPTLEQIAAGTTIHLKIEPSSVVAEESKVLQEKLASGDWLAIIERYPIRETPALSNIWRGVGLLGQKSYESAVLQVLKTDVSEADFIRNLLIGVSSS